jgi:hypothetical protein
VLTRLPPGPAAGSRQHKAAVLKLGFSSMDGANKTWHAGRQAGSYCKFKAMLQFHNAGSRLAVAPEAYTTWWWVGAAASCVGTGPLSWRDRRSTCKARAAQHVRQAIGMGWNSNTRCNCSNTARTDGGFDDAITMKTGRSSLVVGFAEAWTAALAAAVPATLSHAPTAKRAQMLMQCH